tara:strand:+ start:8630 stop:9562 length:933 start_codon:yes stop_codon:yes gene_type:complete
MEDLNEIFTAKNITESSRKLYVANLIRLNGGLPPKNLKFLNDVEGIKGKLEKYKPNTQRSYIISIVSLLKSLKEKQKKFSKLYDNYYSILDNMNKTLKDNTGKTDKEEKEWIGQDAVKEKLEEQLKVIEELKDKKKLTSEEYDKLLHLVVLSLFVLQKPRRNKDYQTALITKKYKAEYGTEKNFLDLFKNEFLFNEYKTQGTYKTQIVSLAPLMREVIEFYLKFHPLKSKLREKDALIPLLVDYQGEPFTQNNSLTRMLYKIFGSKIGSSMLRKLFLTDKYADVMKEMKDDVAAMGTSTGTAQTNYIKKD